METPAKKFVPDGYVSLPLTRRELEIYLCLLHETMDVAQMLAAQLRAIEIIAAHDKLDEKKIA